MRIFMCAVCCRILQCHCQTNSAMATYNLARVGTVNRCCRTATALWTSCVQHILSSVGIYVYHMLKWFIFFYIALLAAFASKWRNRPEKNNETTTHEFNTIHSSHRHTSYRPTLYVYEQRTSMWNKKCRRTFERRNLDKKWICNFFPVNYGACFTIEVSSLDFFLWNYQTRNFVAVGLLALTSFSIFYISFFLSRVLSIIYISFALQQQMAASNILCYLFLPFFTWNQFRLSPKKMAFLQIEFRLWH